MTAAIECLLLEDCCAATKHENHLAALDMIKMQGGVFGAVATSTADCWRRCHEPISCRLKGRAPSLEAIGMTKIFGPLVALDDVSIKVEAGSFHALLGENGAGKSTLVKCIMGFYSPDKGQVLLDGKEVSIKTPRDARAHGIGMVYQHFTLVPSPHRRREPRDLARRCAGRSSTGARSRRRSTPSWSRCRSACRSIRRCRRCSAGEKQKLEILKLLYLDQRFMILDEPTSVLTPGEADEMLGLLGGMADAQGDHGADDLAQVPRGESLLRPFHRAAARQVHRLGRRAGGRASPK